MKHFIIVLFSLAFSGCAMQYGPTRTASDLGYVARPVLDKGETAVNSFQLTGAYNSENGFNSNEVNQSIEVATNYLIHRSNLGYSFGVFGYAGRYLIRSPESRALYNHGFGARMTVYKNVIVDRVRWRPYGLEASISYEGGEYFNFRSEVQNEGSISRPSIDKWVPSIGVSSEVLILPEFLKYSSFGIRATIGASFYQEVEKNLNAHELIVISPFIGISRYSVFGNFRFDRRFGATIGGSIRF
ncbi:MAG: hypothetical protein AAF789_02445 [Bacteroidota bacterium]